MRVLTIALDPHLLVCSLYSSGTQSDVSASNVPVLAGVQGLLVDGFVVVALRMLRRLGFMST